MVSARDSVKAKIDIVNGFVGFIPREAYGTFLSVSESNTVCKVQSIKWMERNRIRPCQYFSQ